MSDSILMTVCKAKRGGGGGEGALDKYVSSGSRYSHTNYAKHIGNTQHAVLENVQEGIYNC